jgi:hypothetical protein
VQAFCTLRYSSALAPVSSFAFARVNGRDYSIAVIQSDAAKTTEAISVRPPATLETRLANDDGAVATSVRIREGHRVDLDVRDRLAERRRQPADAPPMIIARIAFPCLR